jgi:hypothetical protein
MTENENPKHLEILMQKSLFTDYFNQDHDLNFTPKYSLDGKLIDIKDLPEKLFNYHLLKNSKIGESPVIESDLKKYEIGKWNNPCKEKLFEVLVLLSLFKHNHTISKYDIVDLEHGTCDHLSFEKNGEKRFIIGNFNLSGLISDITITPDIMITKVDKSEIFSTDQIIKIIECKPTKKLTTDLLHNYFGKMIDLKIKDLTIITCNKVPEKTVVSASRLGIKIVVFPLYNQEFVEGLLRDNINQIDEKLKLALSI